MQRASVRSAEMMTARDDDRFRPRVSPPRGRGAGRGGRFVSQVIQAGSTSGVLGVRTFAPTRRAGALRGRGHVAARFVATAFGSRARRVIVKARLVVLRTAGARSTLTHLRYVARAGVTREGAEGQLYGPHTDSADTAAFEARGRSDRHQFRFIVAPEDSANLGDLRSYTRSLTASMERDLGTRLDWVAVDHWDTDNPHTHIILRGKDEGGSDLVIAREYISHGMRARASQIATEWLGPRTDREIESALEREVSQRRWTSLDRVLARQVRDGRIDVQRIRAANGTQREKARLIGRLQSLSAMGLAQQTELHVWRVRADAEAVLRSLSERDDIVRTMQRALGTERRELVINELVRGAHVVGRIAGKALVDELHDRGYLVVDAIDGHAHYVQLAAGADLADFPIGGIVETRNTDTRYADRVVAAVARDGVYRTADHLSAMRSKPAHGLDPAVIVEACKRRLEALRRGGIVERIGEGVWRVPADLAIRGRVHDDRTAPISVPTLRSHLPIEQQKRAIGATWLDQQLLKPFSPGSVGFGAVVADALHEREGFLIEQGLAERRGARVIINRNLLATLRERELATEGARLASETGLGFRPAVEGQRVSGIYRRALMLASGRFAMIDDGVGFSLLPWRSVLESRLGQTLRGVVQGGQVSWEFHRQLAIAR